MTTATPFVRKSATRKGGCVSYDGVTIFNALYNLLRRGLLCLGFVLAAGRLIAASGTVSSEGGDVAYVTTSSSVTFPTWHVNRGTTGGVTWLGQWYIIETGTLGGSQIGPDI